MTGPLADVRVIAIEQYGAGPFGTMQLADLGADVIKIEDPSVGGDVSRYVPPYQAGTRLALLREFQPEQAIGLARSPASRRAWRARGSPPERRRACLQSARRPARPAAAALRGPRAGEPAPRLRVALRVRDNRPTSHGRRLRLHRAGARRLDEPDGGPRPASHEERAIPRRFQRRVRDGACHARRGLAGAPRWSWLRRRPLALRVCARAADLHRRLGCLPGL